jgi:hypothetical protein
VSCICTTTVFIAYALPSLFLGYQQHFVSVSAPPPSGVGLFLFFTFYFCKKSTRVGVLLHVGCGAGSDRKMSAVSGCSDDMRMLCKRQLCCMPLGHVKRFGVVSGPTIRWGLCLTFLFLLFASAEASNFSQQFPCTRGRQLTHFVVAGQIGSRTCGKAHPLSKYGLHSRIPYMPANTFNIGMLMSSLYDVPHTSGTPPDPSFGWRF